MFKSAKDNLIASFIFWIISLVVIYYTISFDPPLWFNILFPLSSGLPVLKYLMKVIRKEDEA